MGDEIEGNIDDAPEVNDGDGDAEAEPGAEKKNRVTTEYLTKYERARILGTRSLQISMGAPPTVNTNGETDPLVIAAAELAQKKIPIVIRRFLPDGSWEDWKLSDLVYD